MFWDCIPSIRRAQRPVKIPDRSEGQFAATGFVHVAAESQGIDIKGQDIEQVMINCRIDIDIFCVASFGILEIEALSAVPHLVKKTTDILLLGVTLGLLDLHFFRVDISNI